MPDVSRRSFEVQVTRYRSAERARKRRFTGNEVRPCDLEALAASLADELEALGGERDDEGLALDTDFALKRFLELGRHARIFAPSEFPRQVGSNVI